MGQGKDNIQAIVYTLESPFKELMPIYNPCEGSTIRCAAIDPTGNALLAGQNWHGYPSIYTLSAKSNSFVKIPLELSMNWIFSIYWAHLEQAGL